MAISNRFSRMSSTAPRCLVGILIALSLGGCTSLAQNLDAEYTSSMPYDAVDCGRLAAMRNQEAASHGLAPNATVDQEWAMPLRSQTGIAVYVPDYRSREAKEIGAARGRIEAMNHSMQRRACPGAAALGRSR